MPARRPRNWVGRSAHIAPLHDGTDGYVAHVEGRQRIVDQPPGPFDDVEAAVAWARERAPVVVVRLDGEDVVRRAEEGPRSTWPVLPEERPPPLPPLRPPPR